MAYKKYYLYKEQYSIDNGETWLDVEPLTLSPNGTAIGTYDTEADCEGQPTPTGDSKYIAYYSNGTSYAAACDSTSAITDGEIPLSNLVEVEIGDCVTTIGNSAFENCSTLSSVTIPNSVTYIGRMAFNSCTNITHLVIPSSVNSIGEYAFGYCTRLQDITMLGYPPNLAAGGVFNNTNNCPIYVPCGCVDSYKNQNVWSANYKYRIYPWIECGTGEAQYRWYPSGTTCVGVDKWERSIKQVSYNSGSTWNNVVPQVSSATTLIEVNSQDCQYVPPSSGTKLLLHYNNGTTYSAACDSSSAVTSADTRPNGYEYSAITSAEIGDCVNSISAHAFDECDSLSSVTIPSTVTRIGARAFYSCNNLAFINIPSSVTYIGGGAFSNCNGLASIVINRTTPPTLGSGGFDFTGSCPIYVPSGSVVTYARANEWSYYANRFRAIPT